MKVMDNKQMACKTHYELHAIFYMKQLFVIT